MKRFIFLSLIFATTILYTKAQSTNSIIDELNKAEPQKDTTNSIFTAVEQSPEPQGGMKGFYTFVIRQIQIPELVSIFGIKGKVVVSFNVDKTGHVNNVKPVTAIGLGMDEKIADIISSSPQWTPGRQNGRSIGVNFTLPFNFNLIKDTITTTELSTSSYTFIFDIKGILCDLNQAKATLGTTFARSMVISVTPYTDIPPFKIKDKNRLYLIKLKS